MLKGVDMNTESPLAGMQPSDIAKLAAHRAVPSGDEPPLVRVRSGDLQRFVGLLVEAGGSVAETEAGRALVLGLTAECVGRVAANHGIALSELTEGRST